MTREQPSHDRWTTCRLGHIHWGALGGAGLLLRYAPKQGVPRYLLEQRSRWVDEGGSWGIPGGAIRSGESPEDAALRETEEEIAGLPMPSYRVSRIDVQDCGGGWKFYIVCADVDHAFDAYCRRETDATGWFTREEMWTLLLHPGFRKWVDDPSHIGASERAG